MRDDDDQGLPFVMTQHPKLGRVQGTLPANAPRLEDHKARAIIAPPVLNRSHLPFRPILGGNDYASSCTCVAVANTIKMQMAAGGHDTPVSDASAVALYSAITGYPATDPGAYEVDVLRYQATHGFDAHGPTKWYGLWATFDPADLNLLRVVMARYAGAYLAVNLALADQTDGVWDTTTPGDQNPGSWGAHAVTAWDFEQVRDDDSHLRLATWGRLQTCSWKWLKSRLIEAHMLVYAQAFDQTGRSFFGLNMEQLAADVAACGDPT